MAELEEKGAEDKAEAVGAAPADESGAAAASDSEAAAEAAAAAEADAASKAAQSAQAESMQARAIHLADVRGRKPVEPALIDLVMESVEAVGGGEASHDDQGRVKGQASATYRYGHRYEGEFDRGMMHGNGVYTWSDGTVYKGEFESNQISGRGDFTWPDGSTYSGEVKDGRRHGYGTFCCGGSDIKYVGQWEMGKRHGQGALYYDADLVSLYTGGWVNDMREGQGRIVYKSGNEYVGDWRADKKHGKGTMTWRSRKERYEGDWVDDNPEGTGVHIWLDPQPGARRSTQRLMCNRYEGGFRAGLRHGSGIFYYSNGAKYDGEFEDNLKHGNGVYTFEDGSIYEGGFVRDRMADGSGRSKGGKPEPKGTPLGRMIALRIDDLLSDMPDKEAKRERKEVNNTLLRWNSELKQIYQYYSAYGATDVNTMFTMSLQQFWTFCKDCSLPTASLTLSSIDAIVQLLRKRHVEAVAAARAKRDQTASSSAVAEAREIAAKSHSQGRHDPKDSLLFREFLEALVRIADARYADNEELSSLSKRLGHLLFCDVRGRAMKVPRDPFRVFMREDNVRRVLRQNDKFLRTLFYSYAKKDMSTQEARLHSRTCNAREFLILLRDCELIRSGFTVRDATSIFLRANYERDDDYDDLTEEEVNLETEMILEEFIEGVARVAHEYYKPTGPVMMKEASDARRRAPGGSGATGSAGSGTGGDGGDSKDASGGAGSGEGGDGDGDGGDGAAGADGDAGDGSADPGAAAGEPDKEKADSPRVEPLPPLPLEVRLTRFIQEVLEPHAKIDPLVRMTE